MTKNIGRKAFPKDETSGKYLYINDAKKRQTRITNAYQGLVKTVTSTTDQTNVSFMVVMLDEKGCVKTKTTGRLVNSEFQDRIEHMVEEVGGITQN